MLSMATFYDQSVRGSAESWRSIRARRARVPVAADDSSDREQTFRSSLEQAEQLFKAADAIGYESRPLNLFYGLSQAGRAIAAASSASAAGGWALRGHGITCKNLDDNWASVTELVVAPTKDGKRTSSFSGVSQCLGSPPLEKDTRISDVVPLLFESSLEQPFGNQQYAPLIVSSAPHVFPVGDGPYGTADVCFELPMSLRNTPLEDRENFTSFLQRYPTLRAVEFRPQSGLPTVNDWLTGDELRFLWSPETPAGGAELTPPFASRYRGHLILFPELPNYSAPLHPLMAWWVSLYVLSMAARYAPAQWTSAIDVDVSPEATSLEYVLDVALDAVPDLIDEALATL